MQENIEWQEEKIRIVTPNLACQEGKLRKATSNLACQEALPYVNHIGNDMEYYANVIDNSRRVHLRCKTEQ